MGPKCDTAALQRRDRVRVLRKERGLSQEAFALAASIRVNRLSSIERGVANPSFLLLLAISRALRVKMSVLVEAN